MLELFLHASPVPRSEAIYRIRPVVIDTTFLVSDLPKATRCGQETDYLLAVKHGSLRGFAPHHVWAEMGRKYVDEGKSPNRNGRIRPKPLKSPVNRRHSSARARSSGRGNLQHSSGETPYIAPLPRRLQSERSQRHPSRSNTRRARSTVSPTI